MRSEDKISYRIDGPFFIIQLVNPKTLNSMTREDYLYIGSLVEKADLEKDVYFTVFQSSGRLFSSGADFVNIGEKNDKSDEPELSKWLSNFVSTNLYVTQAMVKHSKVLICCLNGPAIGMSAALVALCDIVYSKNDKVYLHYPFASLGLVTEGGTGVTLPKKIGMNAAMEKLLFSKPFTYDVLKNNVVVQNYNMQDTDEFNEKCLSDLKSKTATLHLPSCLGMKKLINANMKEDLTKINTLEVTDALGYWLEGEPQRRFKQLQSKERVHKL